MDNIEAMTPEAFADWCISENRYSFFKAIKWAEGWSYCLNRGYAIKTGYAIVVGLLKR